MEQSSGTHIPTPFKQTYFHGTKADLKIGELIQVGFQSNYDNRALKHVYVSATLHTALLGAELAKGDGPERIYLVEATGNVEDDPNVTDKKFPGNPTMSFRSEQPFKVIGEVTVFHKHTIEEIPIIRIAKIAKCDRILVGGAAHRNISLRSSSNQSIAIRPTNISPL